MAITPSVTQGTAGAFNVLLRRTRKWQQKKHS
jgi:hypothetical protein